VDEAAQPGEVSYSGCALTDLESFTVFQFVLGEAERGRVELKVVLNKPQKLSRITPGRWAMITSRSNRSIRERTPKTMPIRSLESDSAI